MNEKSKRNKEIARLQREGESFRKLAKRFNVSSHRVFQVVEREKKRGGVDIPS